MYTYYVGLDMGGTKLKAAVLDEGYQIIKTFYCTPQNEKTTREMCSGEWKKLITPYLAELEQEYHALPSAFGISTPGIPKKDHTAIGHMPERLTDIQGLDWSELLKYPGKIYTVNDAKAAFIGEIQADELKHIKNICMLTLGTGVGGAAKVDGILLEGNIGRAGHLGNMSVDMEGRQALTGIPGGLDNLVGNCQISERTHGLYDDPLGLEMDYVKGDPAAVEYWLKMVKALAVGIASLINILDPEIVIIGGGIANAGKNLFGPLKRYLDLYEWRPYGIPTKIIPAANGDFSGAIGAAIFAHAWQLHIDSGSKGQLAI
ncbi:ROK family protein [Sediminispirochaeta smaragdinae]|uniref:ROK family protein n=1 Tax=Sediminispirochaeta smaragdinae (strain DSM 11293 / JCM 15392 / SEBR 4228) TaxID=573413 RepID=E1R7L1_SEDSS|nr:ROK family protein [Sediminispirochaeta smaragdinae]ADK82716.1 ROK family protein [Sediminispirochaeta smaragdinae DSM 11293]